jgi:hypothetical protein
MPEEGDTRDEQRVLMLPGPENVTELRGGSHRQPARMSKTNNSGSRERTSVFSRSELLHVYSYRLPALECTFQRV